MGFPVKEPALSAAQAAEVVRRHAAGEGVAALAREFKVKVSAVQYQLKKSTGKPAASPAPDLRAPDLAALAEDPTIKAVLDQMVADRLSAMMAGMAAPAETTPAAAGSDNNLAHLMSRMFDVLSMQQPGFKQPLAPEELERRMAGKVEMDALLADHKRGFQRDRGHLLPEWRVGEKGFFECVDAIELHEGATFSTYLPPVEDFEPLNDEAEAVKAAMMKWLGGPTADIGEQVKNAHIEAKRVIVPGAMAPSVTSGSIQNVTHAKDSSEPARPRKRQMGTLVEEPRQINGGHASEPVGPQFVEA